MRFEAREYLTNHMEKEGKMSLRMWSLRCRINFFTISLHSFAYYDASGFFFTFTIEDLGT